MNGISKIYNWDGLLDFEEMVRSLKIPKDTEIIYHNSFKLLKNAKEKIKNNEFEEAKNYLNLIKIIDPKSQEAFEGEKILNEIKNEELKIQINKKIVEAERLEDSKKYIEAIKIYEEILRDYNEEIIPKEVLKEKILKIKNNLKEIEEKEIKEQEILKEKMEKERREVEKRKKEMELEEKKVREEKRRVLLNNLRILKNQKKFEEGLEIIEQLKTSYGQEEDVKKEIGLFIKEAGKAMFEEAINFFNNSEYQKSLKFLYYANSWDNSIEEIEIYLNKIGKKIKAGEIEDMTLAEYLWQPSTSTNLIFYPPANPQEHYGEIYEWAGILEQKIDDIYVLKFGNNSFCFTANFSLKNIHFNKYTSVIGKYIGNVEFKTVLGVPVNIPCLDALYVK